MKLETQNGATSERNLMCPVKYIDIKVGNMQDMYEMAKNRCIYMCYIQGYISGISWNICVYIHI